MCILIILFLFPLIAFSKFPERSLKIPEMYNYLNFLFQTTKDELTYEYKSSSCSIRISNIVPSLQFPDHYYPVFDSNKIFLSDKTISFVFDIEILSNEIKVNDKLSSITYHNIYAEQSYNTIEFTLEKDNSLSYTSSITQRSFYISTLDIFGVTKKEKYADVINSRNDDLSKLFDSILTDFISSVIKIYPLSNTQYYFEKLRNNIVAEGYFEANIYISTLQYIQFARIISITSQSHQKIYVGKSKYENLQIDMMYSLSYKPNPSEGEISYHRGMVYITAMHFGEEEIEYEKIMVSGPFELFDIFKEKFTHEYNKMKQY